MEKILRLAADTLRIMGKPITPTYLMWQVMNDISDEELKERNMSITEVAEEVEQYFNVKC